LLYTALQILLLEAFFDHLQLNGLASNCLNKLKSSMEQIPSEFVVPEISEKWFTCFLQDIKETDILTLLRSWATACAEKNSIFRLWFFILHDLLQPLLEIYISIRTSNFAGRNAAFNRFAPLFFSTNHLNYSRLCAQHLFDLQTCSSYLFNRLSRSFAVVRSQRRFSSKTYSFII
jgi:hypothetical protein